MPLCHLSYEARQQFIYTYTFFVKTPLMSYIYETVKWKHIPEIALKKKSAIKKCTQRKELFSFTHILKHVFMIFSLVISTPHSTVYTYKPLRHFLSPFEWLFRYQEGTSSQAECIKRQNTMNFLIKNTNTLLVKNGCTNIAGNFFVFTSKASRD